MTLLESVFLGVVQGLTEFLPISSSGHLVFLQELLVLPQGMIPFDVVVHFGTLLVVLIYFWQDVFQLVRDTFVVLLRFPLERDRRRLLQEHPYFGMAGLIIVASVPTAVIGFMFRDTFESLFSSVFAVGIAWLIMGTFLATSWVFQQGTKKLSEMRYPTALIIGVLQGIAILPGISRSGITILAGMLLGLDKKEAARFSFWIAIPAVLGAGILELGNGAEFLKAYPIECGSGFLSAAVVGFAAIVFLMWLVQRGRFFVFGFYCWVLGFTAILYHFAFVLPE